MAQWGTHRNKFLAQNMEAFQANDRVRFSGLLRTEAGIYPAEPRAGRCARIEKSKMSKQEIPSPNELWENLLNINPQHFNGTYPDIDMLRVYYQRYLDREESKVAKLSFQKAMDNWDDEQIREFVDLITESQVPLSAPSEELRRGLIRVYEKIFEP